MRPLTRAALGLSMVLLGLGAAWLDRGSLRTGLVLTLTEHPGGAVLLSETVPGIDSTILRTRRDLPRRFFSARWSGFWYRSQEGVVDLRLRAEDPARVRIDGRVVLVRKPDARISRFTTSLPLGKGVHSLELDYESFADAPDVRLAWAPSGETPRPLGPLFPSPVEASSVETHLLLRKGAALLFIVAGAGLVLCLFGIRGLVRGGDGRGALGTRAWSLLVVGVLLYAAALRFEALVVRYWSAEAPDWVVLLSQSFEHLRPARPPWEPEANPYRGDPSSYLRYAQEMRHFYDAHVREPVFVFATKVFLGIFSGQAIAVNFASSTFSLAAVLATYLLGAQAFSRRVGLFAAAAFAVERQVISLSVEGWRDDAFTFFVLLSAWALLRLDRSPRFGPALVSGLIGALACLTRITSLSFLLPGYLLVALKGPRRAERLKAVALSLFILSVAVGPYLATCALVFHDPFYSINAHTGYYRSVDWTKPMPWWRFVSQAARPAHLVDTAVIGLTSYPFYQKWHGFDSWAPNLGEILSWCALAGMLEFLLYRRGRFLLVILVSSLAPYAFTYEFAGGNEWRFRLHAYPFYLLAAGLFLVRLVSLLRPARARRVLTRAWRNRWPLALLATLTLALGALGWLALSGLYYLHVKEDISGGEGMIQMGPRDLGFLGGGWYPPQTLGNETVRFSHGRSSALVVPLEAGCGYALTLRMDPLPFAPPQSVKVFLNGAQIAEIGLVGPGHRIGAYSFRLPAEAVREGRNRLEFLSAYSTREGGGRDVGFLLWALRLEKGLAHRPPEGVGLLLDAHPAADLFPVRPKELGLLLGPEGGDKRIVGLREGRGIEGLLLQDPDHGVAVGQAHGLREGLLGKIEGHLVEGGA
jgi:hypothetical protein